MPLGLKGFQVGHPIYWKKPPMLGRKLTEEQKGKISEKMLGRKFTKEWREKMMKPKSKGMREKLSKSISGKNHWNWKGGITPKNQIERKTAKYKEWVKNVFIKDNYTCLNCGERNGNGIAIYLEAHHIKNWAEYPELRYKVLNGMTFCKECHKLIRGLEKKFEITFELLMAQ